MLDVSLNLGPPNPLEDFWVGFGSNPFQTWDKLECDGKSHLSTPRDWFEELFAKKKKKKVALLSILTYSP